MSTASSPAPAEPGKTPTHVAIIMDGNGRWAQQRGLIRSKGHEKGTESVRVAIRACRKLGIRYLTLYAFSVENWNRPKPEIEALMNLLKKFLRNEVRELHENKVRLRAIGRLSDLPKSVRRELNEAMRVTEHYKDATLVLALSYGGRTEIAHAAQALARKVKAGELDPDAIDEAAIAANLYAPDIPDPDLMIRTSGEMRISNFLLWQLSYSELYITDTLWPDFREEHMVKAVEEYSRRHRRYGGLV
ncbi:MAG: isoprenyl transferase [bacterium]